MKKFITIIGSIILTHILYAQPTFDNSVMGAIGDSWTWTGWDATEFNVGVEGEDITWDFSGISITGPATLYKNVNPAATPFVGTFGLATLASTTDDMNYSYSQVTATQFNNLGAGSVAATVSYSNPETILTFPLTYDVTNDDTFGAMFTSGGISFNRSGDVHMEADGYGTLILPTGTFTNALRVKLEEDYGDESIGLPVAVNIDYNFDNYYWLVEGITGPVLYYGKLETTTLAGSTTVEVGFLNGDAVAAVNDAQLSDNVITVYPNPASDIIFIGNTLAIDFEYISLYDITGRLVLQSAASNNQIIPLQIFDLPAGIYTLQMSADAGVISKTISIE